MHQVSTFIFLFLILSSIDLQAQDINDFAFFNTEIEVLKTELKNNNPKSEIIKKDKNEIQITGQIVYSFYHNLISSQDGSVCNFYPTCSAYCRGALRKNGLIIGGMQSLDRVMRCNGLSPEKYSVDMKRRKLIDHVE